jgi:hypothetical protein
MLHGQTRYSLPSRFLEEIPEGLKKWLTPRFAKRREFLRRSFPVRAEKKRAILPGQQRRRRWVFASART